MKRRSVVRERALILAQVRDQRLDRGRDGLVGAASRVQRECEKGPALVGEFGIGGSVPQQEDCFVGSTKNAQRRRVLNVELLARVARESEPDGALVVRGGLGLEPC